MNQPLHLIEIERDSRCGTWVERYFVEIQAATLERAHDLIEFTARNGERIASLG
jgi:hypothetical protein